MPYLEVGQGQKVGHGLHNDINQLPYLPYLPYLFSGSTRARNCRDMSVSNSHGLLKKVGKVGKVGQAIESKRKYRALPFEAIRRKVGQVGHPIPSRVLPDTHPMRAGATPKFRQSCCPETGLTPLTTSRRQLTHDR
jgi:hypothetical protein